MFTGHEIAEEAETIDQKGIIDRLVSEFLNEPAQSEGLPRDNISVNLFDISTAMTLTHDVLYKFQKVLLRHNHSVTLIRRVK